MSNDINDIVPLDHQLDVDKEADVAVVPSNDNFYISVKGYVARKRPVQHVEQLRQHYEPTAYKVVAELAHRYGVKNIIDIGCGTARHLAPLAKEFNVIGIDYGVNLERAKTAYPHLTFIEADLEKDKGCNVALPEDTLYQSIVIAAEVIEHLVDPLYCFVRLLRHVSSYAAAIVVTSPDRRRLAKVFHWPQSLKGPPINKHHVREWTLQEMSAMFSNVSMHVVFSSWICGKAKTCPTGYTVNKNPYVNQLLVLGNSNVRRVWEDRSLPITIKVTAFVIIHPHTHRELLRYTLEHLANQQVQLFVIQKGCNVTLPSSIPILSSMYITKTEQLATVIKTAIASKEYNYGDWFLVQDANEVITVPSTSGSANLTLRQYLQKVSYGPHCFNAVPLTVVLPNTTKAPFHKEKVPFKIHSLGTWDNSEGKTIYPRRDTLRDKVRIWRKTNSGVKLFTSKASMTGDIITDVHFLGRRVYPFHLMSLRFHPRTNRPNGYRVSKNLALMYGLEIGLGYATATRKAIYESHLPY